jgi:mannose-6-phosphate isomerase-like protein (cupin superfamily)
MRKIVLLALVVLLAAFTWSFAQKGKGTMGHSKTAHVTLTPDELKWGPAPPGLPPGAQLAVLRGDPSKAGMAFHMRAKFPDGYKVAPHWHPTDENIIVIQGTMMIGTGDTFDESKMKELPAGSYGLMPKRMHHFVQARGESIVDIYGTGPFAITYVNPADDPRKK